MLQLKFKDPSQNFTISTESLRKSKLLSDIIDDYSINDSIDFDEIGTVNKVTPNILKFLLSQSNQTSASANQVTQVIDFYDFKTNTDLFKKLIYRPDHRQILNTLNVNTNLLTIKNHSEIATYLKLNLLETQHLLLSLNNCMILSRPIHSSTNLSYIHKYLPDNITLSDLERFGPNLLSQHSTALVDGRWWIFFKLNWQICCRI